MRIALFVLILAAALLALAGGPAGGAEPDDPALADELTLKGAGLATDGPGLLEFFRKRSQGQPGPSQLKALIEQLGESQPALREKAALELVGIGPAAIPWLRQVVHDPDNTEPAGRGPPCSPHLVKPSPPGALLPAPPRWAPSKH